jgi:hypothetical protein
MHFGGLVHSFFFPRGSALLHHLYFQGMFVWMISESGAIIAA